MTIDYIKHKRGIAVLTYNRANVLESILDAIVKTQPELCRIVVCDDGSTDNTDEVVSKFRQVIHVRGPNLGVIANKNRALHTLQDCKFIALVEDDLIPTDLGWFEKYEKASILSGIHHFCRVQVKEVPEVMPRFSEYMSKNGVTPIYGPTPRGDLTFITSKVLKQVGGFNPEFVGAGYGHAEWSHRVQRAGLIPHPLQWVDIKESRDCFVQKGDIEGGRWLDDPAEIRAQLKKNAGVLKRLEKRPYIYYPILLY